MKRILIISSSSSSLYNFRREMIERFLDHNLSVVLCCPKDENYKKLNESFKNTKVKIDSIFIKNTGKNIFKDFILFLQLIWIIKKYEIDAVFSYHMKPVIYGSFTGWMCGIQNTFSMVTGLGYVFTEQKIFLKRFVLKQFLLLALSFNKKIFFHNDDDLNFLFRDKVLRKKAVVINGSGVNLNYFKFTETPEDISFIFLGRLLKHKGIYEYLEAAKIVKQKYPTVSFKIAGGFHSNPSCITKKELDKWTQKKIIDYLGEVEDSLPVIQESSICVLPSYREGRPRSILEAMAVGRAIITTDAPGCKDAIIENYNGYLVPVKGIDKLAEKMECFIKNPQLVKQMGYNSRALAEENYNVHQINEDILKNMGF